MCVCVYTHTHTHTHTHTSSGCIGGCALFCLPSGVLLRSRILPTIYRLQPPLNTTTTSQYNPHLNTTFRFAYNVPLAAPPSSNIERLEVCSQSLHIGRDSNTLDTDTRKKLTLEGTVPEWRQLAYSQTSSTCELPFHGLTLKLGLSDRPKLRSGHTYGDG